jgi:hypothetical protein
MNSPTVPRRTGIRRERTEATAAPDVPLHFYCHISRTHDTVYRHTYLSSGTAARNSIVDATDVTKQAINKHYMRAAKCTHPTMQ